MLKTIGFKVESLDINNNLEPTYVGDISSDDFHLDRQFDCVLCAEVLEHIPFEKLDVCLKNIEKLSCKYVIVTLPNSEFFNRFSIYINNHHVGFKFGKRHAPIAPMHFWELNSSAYCTYDKVRKKISNYYDILDEGKIFDNEYHYYYILKLRT